MPALLAALPIALVLALMLGAGWSATRAGLLGLIATLLIAWLAFGFGVRVLPEWGLAAAAGGALAEAGFTALTILWIIFPALCIHQLQQRSGALEVLQASMARLSADPGVVALLVAWFFALFLEGAAGFGTAVALAAPFLVSAGFDRVRAVTIALIGHSVGVSFGAVGTPILPQIALGFSGVELAAATSLYHGALGWVMALIVMGLATEAGRRSWSLALAAAALFLAPMAILAQLVGPELPTLGGALFGGLAFAALVRRRASASAAVASTGALLRAAAPYLTLVGLVLVTRLVPAVQTALASATLSWALGPFSGSIQPFYHPGTLLFVSFVVTALVRRAPASTWRGAVAGALAQVAAVTLALLAMLGLSRVMVHSGMIATLAETTASLSGAGYPLLAPFVGMLGTFVTGSATTSNILFSDFQLATARALGLPAVPVLGAQGFGAAVGNIVCPHNIIAAGATVALAGQEGKVLRRTLGPALLYAALGGVLALLLVRL
jgi:lactate permease